MVRTKQVPTRRRVSALPLHGVQVGLVPWPSQATYNTLKQARKRQLVAGLVKARNDATVLEADLTEGEPVVAFQRCNGLQCPSAHHYHKVSFDQKWPFCVP